MLRNVSKLLSQLTTLCSYYNYSGADPGFLESGFICIKVCVWEGRGGHIDDFI